MARIWTGSAGDLQTLADVDAIVGNGMHASVDRPCVHSGHGTGRLWREAMLYGRYSILRVGEEITGERGKTWSRRPGLNRRPTDYENKKLACLQFLLVSPCQIVQ